MTKLHVILVTGHEAQVKRSLLSNIVIFQCMVLLYGRQGFHDRLLPILERFCSDPDEQLRCSIAAGFHEVNVIHI